MEKIIIYFLTGVLIFGTGFVVYQDKKHNSENKIERNIRVENLNSDEEWNKFLLINLGVDLKKLPKEIRVPEFISGVYNQREVNKIINYIIAYNDSKYTVAESKLEKRANDKIYVYTLKLIK